MNITTTLKSLSFLLLLAVSWFANSTEEITYYYTDALGTPVVSTNASGQEIWRKVYTPFGAKSNVSGDDSGDNVGFTGHVEDEFGLTYMGARYYNPDLAIFYGYDPAVVDPLAPFTVNRYIYANNNPYKYVDPDGRASALAACVAGPFGCAAGVAVTALTLHAASVAVQSNSGPGGQAGPFSPSSGSGTGDPCSSFPGLCDSGDEAESLGKAASSRVLGNNMESTGMSRPANSAAHHMVAGKDPRAAQARAILKREGIDINSSTNGVFLPRASRFAKDGQISHSRIHTNRYYAEVNRRLSRAKPGTVGRELSKIRSELVKGNFSY